VPLGRDLADELRGPQIASLRDPGHLMKGRVGAVVSTGMQLDGLLP
jgi:hypothetical protein